MKNNFAVKNTWLLGRFVIFAVLAGILGRPVSVLAHTGQYIHIYEVDGSSVVIPVESAENGDGYSQIVASPIGVKMSGIEKSGSKLFVRLEKTGGESEVKKFMVIASLQNDEGHETAKIIYKHGSLNQDIAGIIPKASLIESYANVSNITAFINLPSMLYDLLDLAKMSTSSESADKKASSGILEENKELNDEYLISKLDVDGYDILYQVPEIHGELEITRLELSDRLLRTASGDIKVRVSFFNGMPERELSTGPLFIKDAGSSQYGDIDGGYYELVVMLQRRKISGEVKLNYVYRLYSYDKKKQPQLSVKRSRHWLEIRFVEGMGTFSVFSMGRKTGVFQCQELPVLEGNDYNPEGLSKKVSVIDVIHFLARVAQLKHTDTLNEDGILALQSEEKMNFNRTHSSTLEPGSHTFFDDFPGSISGDVIFVDGSASGTRIPEITAHSPGSHKRAMCPAGEIPFASPQSDGKGLSMVKEYVNVGPVSQNDALVPYSAEPAGSLTEMPVYKGQCTGTAGENPDLDTDEYTVEDAGLREPVTPVPDIGQLQAAHDDDGTPAPENDTAGSGFYMNIGPVLQNDIQEHQLQGGDNDTDTVKSVTSTSSSSIHMDDGPEPGGNVHDHHSPERKLPLSEVPAGESEEMISRESSGVGSFSRPGSNVSETHKPKPADNHEREIPDTVDGKEVFLSGDPLYIFMSKNSQYIPVEERAIHHTRYKFLSIEDIYFDSIIEKGVSIGPFFISGAGTKTMRRSNAQVKGDLFILRAVLEKRATSTYFSFQLEPFEKEQAAPASSSLSHSSGRIKPEHHESEPIVLRVKSKTSKLRVFKGSVNVYEVDLVQEMPSLEIDTSFPESILDHVCIAVVLNVLADLNRRQFQLGDSFIGDAVPKSINQVRDLVFDCATATSAGSTMKMMVSQPFSDSIHFLGDIQEKTDTKDNVTEKQLASVVAAETESNPDGSKYYSFLYSDVVAGRVDSIDWQKTQEWPFVDVVHDDVTAELDRLSLLAGYPLSDESSENFGFYIRPSEMMWHFAGSRYKQVFSEQKFKAQAVEKLPSSLVPSSPEREITEQVESNLLILAPGEELQMHVEAPVGGSESSSIEDEEDETSREDEASSIGDLSRVNALAGEVDVEALRQDTERLQLSDNEQLDEKQSSMDIQGQSGNRVSFSDLLKPKEHLAVEPSLDINEDVEKVSPQLNEEEMEKIQFQTNEKFSGIEESLKMFEGISEINENPLGPRLKKLKDDMAAPLRAMVEAYKSMYIKSLNDSLVHKKEQESARNIEVRFRDLQQYHRMKLERISAAVNSSNAFVLPEKLGVDNTYDENPFMAACRTGNIPAVNACLERYPELVNTLFSRTHFGGLHENITGLHMAAAGGYDALIRLLLDWGGEPNIPSGHGEVALTVAVRNKKWSVVDLLLEKMCLDRGVSPESIKPLDNSDWKMTVSGRGIVHSFRQACIEGDQEMVEYILKRNIVHPDIGMQCNHPDDGSSCFQTGVSLASQYGHEGIVSTLYSYGASVDIAVQSGDGANLTPLQLAARYKNLGVVLQLWDKVSWKSRDELLMKSITEVRPRLAQWLHSHGASLPEQSKGDSKVISMQAEISNMLLLGTHLLQCEGLECAFRLQNPVDPDSFRVQELKGTHKPVSTTAMGNQGTYVSSIKPGLH